MKKAAGTLLYRQGIEEIEILLVRPAGSKRREKRWSIPKGTIRGKESNEQAARRETLEETGIMPGELNKFGSVRYSKKRKRVVCFIGTAPEDVTPNANSWDVDRAEFIPLTTALEMLHLDQLPLLTQFQQMLEAVTVA